MLSTVSQSFILVDMEYELLLQQWKALLDDEEHLISVLSNTSALIKEFYGEDVNWAGFYFMEEKDLILGPFQGKVACICLKEGKGVCQRAVKEKKTVIVDDVHSFDGHIACDSASNSEIVIPVFKEGDIWGVLDIDSPNTAQFSKEDAIYLEAIVRLLEKKLN